MFESEFTRRLKPKTLGGYQKTYQLFKQIIAVSEPEAITANNIALFFKTLQERKRAVGKTFVQTGIKKSTVATYWSKLSAFFSWLENKQYIIKNPLSQMNYPTPAYEDKKFLRKRELERILTAIHLAHNNNLLLLKRNLLLFHLLLLCGLRKEELLQLQVRDIDFERRLLTIRHETSKSGRTRTIPLHSSLMIYLKDYLSERRKLQCPFLLVSCRTDTPLTESGIKHLVLALRNQSGVRFHLHQFRHTFAVNFLKTNNNIAKLKQLLGHKSLSMTLVYLRCIPAEEMKQDIESMSIDKMI